MTVGPLPVALHLAGRCAVVVGAGAVAARKIGRLREAGAAVTVVAPDAVADVADAATDGAVTWHRRGYASGDLDGALLVVAATADAGVNDRVAADADAAGVLCVRADRPDPAEDGADAADRGTASFMATVARGPLQLAVSTGGAGPALAAHLARDLAGRYGPEWGELAALLGELRRDPSVVAALAGCDDAERAARWRSVLTADTLQHIRTGNRARAKEVALSCLSSPAD